MPITSPAMLNSGPPELPGLMGASVWMKSSKGPAPMSRPRAETMPLVTLPPRPKGLPAASTHCPTRRFAETPSETAESGARGVIRSRAMSVNSSTPTTRAGYSLPSWVVTVTRVALPTTCPFVTTMPCGSMMKPDPAPCTSCPRRPRSKGAPR